MRPPTAPAPDAQDLDRLVNSARAGRVRAIARLITLVENNGAQLPALMKRLTEATGHAHVVGITGSPGVGKSTSTTALVAELRRRGLRVGVLAVDPSSPFSGGAVLGDRVRMQQHFTDPGVYIRSMATRGHLGGLATAAPQSLRVFDLAGFDVVLVETVGVGQSEVEIASAADTTCVLLAPGMGDGIQAAKAGILEIGDIFVVNKADRDGAQHLVRELRTMIAMADRDDLTWKPPIVRTVAQRQEGASELVETILAHREHGERSGQWQQRRLQRSRTEIEALALAGVRRRFATSARDERDELAEQVRDGRLDPYAAADRLLQISRPDQESAAAAGAVNHGGADR